MELQEKFLTVEERLNNTYIGREDLIRSMLQAVLSRKHLLMLGPPGTAKTSMAQSLAKMMGMTFYRRLVNQYSTPEDLFGPVDIQKYKERSYERILDKTAADSQLVLLDEVFKAGPSILNTLLSMMEERIVDNGLNTVNVPLMTLIGTSNELPNPEDGLDAFLDRLLIKHYVGYLESGEDFRLMMQTDLNLNIDGMEDYISIEELKQAQAEVSNLKMSLSTLESLEVMWETCREEGIVVSDRTWKVMTPVMAAESWLSGYSTIAVESVIAAENIIWTKPDDIRQVKRIVRGSLNPSLTRAEEIYEAAKEAYDEFIEMEYINDTEGLALLTKLREQVKAIAALDSSSSVKAIEARTMALVQELLQKLGGL